MKLRAMAIALAALLLAAAPAAAKPKPKTWYYDGETAAGESLSPSLQGKRVFDVDGYISSTCVPTHTAPRSA